MTVLDTFFVMFKTDTSELKKGLDESNRVIDNFTRRARRQIIQVTGLFSVFQSLKSADIFADKMNELADSLDVSTESLSMWADAVKMSGGTQEEFQDTTIRMTAALSDFATKGHSRAAPFFESLGIRMTDAKGRARNFLDILPELADSFSKISKAESLGVGQKMGLDKGTIMLLQTGRKSVEDMIARQKELGFVTKEDGVIAGKFGDTWDELKHVFRTVFVEINTAVLPILRTFFDMIVDLGIVISKHKAILYSLIAVFAAVGAYLFPVISIISAVGLAFGLVYDDIKTFQRGGDSLIGHIIEKYPRFAAIVSTSLKVAFAPIQILISLFKGLYNAIVVLITAGEDLSQSFSDLWESIGSLFDSIFGNIENRILSTMKSIMKYIDIVVGAYRKVKSAIGIGDKKDNAANHKEDKDRDNIFSEYRKKDILGINKSQEMVANASNYANSASSSPINRITTSSILSSRSESNKNTSIKIGDINIQTSATNSNGISSSISDSLKEQMRQTINNYDDGVLA
jgi:hypothetical protein